MAKQKQGKMRNTEAYAMIVSGAGRKQVFKDRRLKRGKERVDYHQEYEQ